MQQNRNRILVAYKELLGLIRRLPLEKQKDVLTEARQRMRDHQYEANPVTQLDLFKRLCERIAFLRIITPRDGGPRSSIGAGTYVIRDGKLVRGTGEKMGTRYVVMIKILIYASTVMAYACDGRS